MQEQQIHVVVAHDSGISGPWVAEHVPADAGFVVTEVVDSLSADSAALRESNGDVLLVACSQPSEEALQLIRTWTEQNRKWPVVMLCHGVLNGYVEQAFAAGAEDIVLLERTDAVDSAGAQQLAFALKKAHVRHRADAEAARAAGTMICVLGPKGGIGKTLTACNLAVALAERGRRTALVDLDLQFGDVSLALGVQPQSTAYDLATSGGALDANKMEDYLATHSTGLRVLAAPLRPDQTALVTPEFMSEVLTVLRAAYQYVVVDTPPTFTPDVIAAIDAASHICMVTMLDALSLKNARLGLETLELMGYPAERIRIVLNRANTNVGISSRDVTSILGREPDILVPSSREVARSVNEGVPILLSQKRSEAAHAFETLSGFFTQIPAQPAAEPRRRRTLLGRSR